MLNANEDYYLEQNEPIKGCLLALRKIILDFTPEITEEWKFKMPFFYFKKKMFCYVWFHKKYKLPYIGIVQGHRIEHPDLIAEKRSRIRILLIEPDKDIPLGKIMEIFSNALRYINSAYRF
jgi:hypothetical protein